MQYILQFEFLGPIDLPTKQKLLRMYRQEISDTKYVVKRKGKVQEQFWLDLLQDWLLGIQQKFDNDMNNSLIMIDSEMGNVSFGSNVQEEAKLALKLLCSYGENTDCRRVRS